MEDHFDKLLYLIVGVIYIFLNNVKRRNTEKQTMPYKPSEHQPAPPTSTNWAHTWEEEAKKVPVMKTPLPQTIRRKMSPPPVDHATTQMTAQQKPGKSVDRVLRRYSSWKKAIIMGELIQPRS